MSIFLTAHLDGCYILFQKVLYALQVFIQLLFNASAGALIVAGGAGGSYGGEYNWMA